MGSNSGRRKALLQKGIQLLELNAGISTKVSSIYKTAPWGFTHSCYFYNITLEMNTPWKPLELLKKINQIELLCGRVRDGNQYVSRTLDIDILFYDKLVLNCRELTIPHPLLHLRRFVLVPLSEIASSHLHPVLNASISQLLVECKDKSSVVKLSTNYSKFSSAKLK